MNAVDCWHSRLWLWVGCGALERRGWGAEYGADSVAVLKEDTFGACRCGPLPRFSGGNASRSPHRLTVSQVCRAQSF